LHDLARKGRSFTTEDAEREHKTQHVIVSQLNEAAGVGEIASALLSGKTKKALTKKSELSRIMLSCER